MPLASTASSMAWYANRCPPALRDTDILSQVTWLRFTRVQAGSGFPPPDWLSDRLVLASHLDSCPSIDGQPHRRFSMLPLAKSPER